MRLRGPQLPACVILRAASPTIDAPTLRATLRATNATLYFWRTAHGMPKPVRCGNASLTDVQALAIWIHSLNVTTIRWI